MESITEALTQSLSDIAWSIFGIILLAGAAALIWKLIENIILSAVERKACERRQKQLEEMAANEIRIERNGPSFEEWKAAQKDKSTN